ncbi:MAG: branched-chain amino acid ABC transporter permease [Candidatus Nanopelagicales bacterium]
MPSRIVTRTVSLLLGLIGLLGVAAIAAGPALAEGEAIQGTLRDGITSTPVAGVTITVTDDSGFEESAVTADDGAWSIDVPKTGSYSVEIDESTLPDTVAPPSKNPILTSVEPGTPRFINFALGSRERNVESTWDRAAQLTVEGFRYGLVIALAAVGLSLIYGTTGLTNFAQGEIVTFGALATWWLNTGVGIQLIPAAILGVVLSGVFGAVQDRGLWKPLRKRGTGLIAMMIVSIGFALALQNLYLILFGGASRPFDDYDTQAGMEFGPISLTPKDLISAVIAIVVLTLAGLALLKTRIGKATRAVSDNPALAASSGIDVERVILVVWVVGAALAGLGGIMLGLTQQVSYLMGQQTLLLVFAAVTLGGLGTAFGALVGSLVVGLFVQLSTLFIAPELKNVGALVVLIVVLIIRPQGILGRRSRVG